MRRFTLRITTRGSLLIGGGEVPDGLHGSHVHDGRGQPFVPATALRGALRETLEALLRGAGQKACDAGSGRELGAKAAVQEAASEVPCALDAGKPCVACRLFGGAREKLAETMADFSAVVLGDGVLTGRTERPWMLRPGVAVSRKHRSAEEDRLYLRRTTATGAVFVAEGRLRDETLEQKLKAAVDATKHIGAGRSHGSARVDLDLQWAPTEEDAPPALLEGDLAIRVTLRTPTILGVPLAHTNLRDTRREIPGSALRGAVGFALAGALTDPERHAAHNDGFQALVDEARGARFGFLSPVDASAPIAGTPSGRLPITSQACKLEAEKHGRYDDLFDRIAISLIADASQAETARAGLRCVRCSYPGCGRPLRAAQGFRGFQGDVQLRVATRASIDRAPASVREGALFTEVYLEPGTVFEGTLRNIPAESRAALAMALSLPLSIGRARGAGRGQVNLEAVQATPREPLRVRGDRFDAALKLHLSRCKLPVDRVGSFIALTLVSPCVLSLESQDEWAPLQALLPEALRSAKLLVRVRRFVREGGWDQRTGEMHAWQAISAGSVYVLELPPGTQWQALIGELEALERMGVGERRHQGYGEVIVFDPIHYAGDRVGVKKGEEEKEMLDEEGARRQKLVIAAEDVMREYALHGGRNGWKVEKSQLNQLVGVCGEALCAEEIANYLRYQASRDRPPWGLQLVERTLEKINSALEGMTDDRKKVEAWRQFAVYLARAHRYQAMVSGGGGRHDNRDR